MQLAIEIRNTYTYLKYQYQYRYRALRAIIVSKNTNSQIPISHITSRKSIIDTLDSHS